MGRFFALATVLLATLHLAGEARAQEPYSAASGVSTSLQPPSGACEPLPGVPALPCCPPPASCDRQPLFGASLMLGQATGVRGQVSVTPNLRDAFVIEGFAGWLFHDLGDSSALGVGGRYLMRTNWLDGNNALQFGPGLDVFFQLNNNGLVLLAPSVDISWLQKLRSGVEWEVGLEAGMGVGVAGHTSSGKSGVGEVTPLISVFTGLRF
jgi:hypothetical protein